MIPIVGSVVRRRCTMANCISTRIMRRKLFAAEGLPDPLLAGRVRVRRQFEGTAVAADLLEPFGEELDQEGARLFGALCGDAHGHTAKEWIAQRNAALSFSKKPSSAL